MHLCHTLHDLAPGQSAAVGELAVQGPLRRRFQDLGLVPGTRVECLLRSPLGDPAAYRIRGAVIALRGRDAARVLLQGPGEAAP